MKKVLTAVCVIAFGLIACEQNVSLSSPVPAVPTQTLSAPAQVPNTLAPAQPQSPATTPVPANNWKLPDPPAPNVLPTELSSAIHYVQPPENCAKENDPNQTCSTIKGQLTDGDFVLKAGQAIVMTGDLIDISENGQILVERPSLDIVHDLWIVVNNTTHDIKLHMLAPHGSFRGYFATDGKWNFQKLAHLRDLHLYLFLLPTQTYDRFTPTPVPNCESQDGCDVVNVRGIVFEDAGMTVASYGLYSEGQPYWQSLLGN